jgi:hypothetical protein
LDWGLQRVIFTTGCGHLLQQGRAMNRHHASTGAFQPDPASAYERDFYAWAMEQAKRIREGAFEALDRENLAEEIASLGNEQFSKLRSAYRVLLMHMLKWDHQPEKRTRSWATTIFNQRLDASDVLDDNPSLKSRLDQALTAAYRRARVEAARETDLPLSTFPEANPYSLDDLMSRPFDL